jgi:hypothetical protein
MTDESLTDEPDTLPATAAAVPERDPRDVAEERLAVIRAEVVELRKTRDAATNRMNKLLEEETQLVSQFRGTEEGGHLVNQRAIMAHLQRQNDVRMARAGRHQQAVASGYSAEDLRGKSAIDAAHARNTSRGTQRPTVG